MILLYALVGWPWPLACTAALRQEARNCPESCRGAFAAQIDVPMMPAAWLVYNTIRLSFERRRNYLNGILGMRLESFFGAGLGRQLVVVRRPN